MRNLNLLSVTAQEKIGKLPFFMRYVIYKLVDCIDDIINGKCDEQILVNTMSTLENNASGRYGKEDLLNYDMAGRLLGLGSNRVRLKRLLDSNGIKQVTINNMKCGFRRSEVLALKDRMDAERHICPPRECPPLIHTGIQGLGYGIQRNKRNKQGERD